MAYCRADFKNGKGGVEGIDNHFLGWSWPDEDELLQSCEDELQSKTDRLQHANGPTGTLLHVAVEVSDTIPA